MRRRAAVLACLATLAICGVSAPQGQAEGRLAPEQTTPAPSRPRVTSRAAPRPAAKPAQPAPTPEDLPPDVQNALTPPAPAALTVEDLAPAELPPLPPTVVIDPAPRTAPAASSIVLSCETRSVRDEVALSRGKFVIELRSSPVFPDTYADFTFAFVDGVHDSLIRRSQCLDIRCTAEVTPGAYYLVNRPDREDSLRIVLDRRQGAFHAEWLEDGHLTAEDGWCVPQERAQPLF